MIRRPVLLAPLFALVVIGCSSEPPPKPDSGAPAVQYKMVPATTGGTSGATGAAPTSGSPAAPTSGGVPNPASPGSD